MKKGMPFFKNLSTNITEAFYTTASPIGIPVESPVIGNITRKNRLEPGDCKQAQKKDSIPLLLCAILLASVSCRFLAVVKNIKKRMSSFNTETEAFKVQTLVKPKI